MKTFIIPVLALSLMAFAGNLSAQDSHYTLKRGNRTGDVLFRAGQDKGMKTLFIDVDGNEGFHVMDGTWRNISWRHVNVKENTDVTISLKDGIYSIAGRQKGKEVNKTVRSHGHPWYQSIAYIGGRTVPSDASVTYECFRPDELSVIVMTASRYPEGDSPSGFCVRTRPTGAAANFFHADYFFSPENKSLTGYRCVEGMPGTPVTTWTAK